MRVFLTGHTGFKGAWLTLLLQERGHLVSGLALDPPSAGLFERAGLADGMVVDARADIRDVETVAAALTAADPEVILHLAAQPLVRASYERPRETFDVNVTGTLNVLEAVAGTDARALVVITTDKVYRNVGHLEGYAEDAPLGGDDPYSASKAMADILTQSWVRSFGGPPTAIARGGNVIGGGDVSRDRLLVDLVRGYSAGETVGLRYPDAVRPWQHVLDCLSGYLTLAAALLDGEGEGSWNFGPDTGGFHTVREIADAAAVRWGDGASWEDTSGDHPHEAALLTLDASKARRELGWRDLLPYPASLEWTLDWEKAVAGGGDARALAADQIRRYQALDPGARWLSAF